MSTSSQASVVDTGIISGTTSSTGSYVAASSTFNLTAAEIPTVELLANFAFIDDGVEIVVNGTSLFLAPDLSQFGPQDFVTSGVQPNDIENPWNTNNNGLPRLTIFSDSSGSAFSGAVTEGATSTVTYLPSNPVPDFTSLLVAGTNTIQFVNHNGFQNGRIGGDFTISTVTSVPEPTSSGLILLGSTMLMLVRRRRA